MLQPAAAAEQLNGSAGPPLPTGPSSANASSPLPSPSPGGGVSPWDIALCATGAAAAGENGLVLGVLLSAPGPRAPALLLIGSLALADLLAGLGLVLNFAVRYALRPPSEAWALGAAGLLLGAFSASAGSLLAITLDRYLSLRHALTYHAERTRPSTCALLLLLWLACAAAALPPALGWHCLRRPAGCSVLRPVTRPHAAALAGAVLLLYALMLQLYARMVRVARRHAQQIAVQRRCLPPARPRGLCAAALVLGALALCWLPFAVYALVADARAPALYTYCLALPAAAHSLLNPLLYAFRHPEVQRALGSACCAPAASSDV
ncbi:G-protein coupled receptor 12-like [Alligator mississippiensis]|uniref:G-protein coupled receptor 12-like n=1 Tax=Alligator mississippiensis TaxID=8496 RepID=UPI002877AE24|nr:G-protein coupled receptor 12-like [Alligator mississippiensis]